MAIQLIDVRRLAKSEQSKFSVGIAVTLLLGALWCEHQTKT